MYADWQAVKKKGVIKVQMNLKDLKDKKTPDISATIQFRRQYD